MDWINVNDRLPELRLENNPVMESLDKFLLLVETPTGIEIIMSQMSVNFDDVLNEEVLNKEGDIDKIPPYTLDMCSFDGTCIYLSSPLGTLYYTPTHWMPLPQKP